MIAVGKNCLEALLKKRPWKKYFPVNTSFYRKPGNCF